MSDIDPPPRVATPFITFAALLRGNGFARVPEQTTAFLSAIVLLGPRDPEDIRRAGLATLAPPPERHGAYDALFRIHFLGEDAPTLGETDDDEEPLRVQEEQRGEDEPPLSDESNESGEAATRGEALVERRFGLEDRDESLRRLVREAPARLPRRRSYRRMRG